MARMARGWTAAGDARGDAAVPGGGGGQRAPAAAAGGRMTVYVDTALRSCKDSPEAIWSSVHVNEKTAGTLARGLQKISIEASRESARKRPRTISTESASPNGQSRALVSEEQGQAERKAEGVGTRSTSLSATSRQTNPEIGWPATPGGLRYMRGGRPHLLRSRSREGGFSRIPLPSLQSDTRSREGSPRNPEKIGPLFGGSSR